MKPRFFCQPVTVVFLLFIFLTNTSLNGQMIGTGSGNHSIAVKADGTVYTWGYNGYGELGNGTYTNSSVPVAVNRTGVLSGKTILQVAAGRYRCIALASDGTLYTWGRNDYGQLGNGTNTDSNVPVAVNRTGVLSGKTILQVAAGRYHCIALASDGTVYTWGYNYLGQLGNGTNTDSNVPVAVNRTGVLSGKTITQVAASGYLCIALASDGTVYTWGSNHFGELGNGTYTNSSVPVAVNRTGVLSGKTITQVAAGDIHCIALASDGTVYTWGSNPYGQLGNGTNTSSNVPVSVNRTGVLAGKTITQVAAGDIHCIALASDGTVYTWGYNENGELGNGTNTNSNVPVSVNRVGVLSGKTITQVAAGADHNIALASDGTICTWGYNLDGQLGNSTNTNSNVPVQVNQSVMGLLSTGLIAYYPFNGNANDASGSNYHGTVEGAVLTADRFGNANSAYSFDGINDRILTPATMLNPPFTFSVWIKTNQDSVFPFATGPVLATAYYHGGYGRGIIAGHENKKTVFGKFPTSSSWDLLDSSVKINDNKWHHIAGSWDGSTGQGKVNLFIDGVLVKNTTSVSSSLVHDFNMRIGHSSDGPWNYWHKGLIDDIKIYNKVLSPQEITTLYREGGWQGSTPAPVPVSPANNSIALLNPVTVKWYKINSAIKYALQVSGDSLFTALAFNDSTITDSLKQLPFLFYNKKYYWRVQAQTQTGWSDWSAVSKFSTNLTGQMIGLGSFHHNVVTKSDGSLYTWGLNDLGQLGNGTNISANYPVAVDMNGVLVGKSIVMVSGGLAHSIALSSDGFLYTWGGNSFGQLGNSTYLNSNLPMAVVMNGALSGKTVSMVAGGYYHNLVLTSDGSLFAWGRNTSGQLGNAGTTSNCNVPQAVVMNGALSGKTVVGIAAGVQHSLAVSSDGKVFTWGLNDNGQLGNGSNTNSGVPVQVNSSGVLAGKTIIMAAGGYFHSIALAADGTVYTWGNNTYGQLGNGNFVSSTIPVAVNTAGVLAGKTIVQVAAGYYHCIAVASDGTVYTWGYNTDGELGNATNTKSNIPVEVNRTGVLAGKSIISVMAGDLHSAALASDGTLYTWGGGIDGQLGNGANVNSNVPVAVNFNLNSNLPPGLIAYYPFTGNANNVMGNWNNGTVSNAILTTDRFGNPNQAYYFNGTNAQITAGSNSQLENTQNHSLSLWAYDSLGITNGCLATYADANGNNGYSLVPDQNSGKMGMWAMQGFSTGGWAAALSNNPLRGDKKWHHYVGVRKNGITYLYVDGVLQQSTTNHAISFVSSAIRIGNSGYWQNNQFFGGKIDDVGYYNRALSDQDVLSIYRAGNWQGNTVLPLLASPANNSKGLINPITLKWYKELTAVKYSLQVSTDSLFTILSVSDSAVTDTLKLLTNLNAYTKYYWRIKAINAGGQSEWSTVWNFKTLGNPYSVTLSLPVHQSVNQPVSNLVFKWFKPAERIESITRYQFQLATDSLFVSIINNDTLLTDTTKTINELTNGTKYYWRVRAQNQVNWGDWSSLNNFVTIIGIPVTPVLALPVNNNKGLVLPLTFKWYRSQRAEKYILQVSTDSLFATLSVSDSAVTDTVKLLTNLNAYTKYYWRIKAINAGGQSEWSTVWNYKTLGNPYSVILSLPGSQAQNQPVSGIVFKWLKATERIETIQKYNFQLSTDSLFINIVKSDSALADTVIRLNTPLLNYITNYYWRVRAQNQTGWGEWSETRTFTTFENIKLLSPNGNERIAGGTTYTITWQGSIATDVKLEYSTDNGLVWLSITDSTMAGTGSFPWVVPEIQTSLCKIKITALENSFITDRSDDYFSIISSRPKIDFAGVTGFETEVVYPAEGSDENLFEYLVKYSSPENKAPKYGYPKVVLDYNGNGIITDPGEGEFSMMPVNSTDTNYISGRLYSFVTLLPVGNSHKVKFIAVDSDGDTALINPELMNYRNVPTVLGGLPDLALVASNIVFSNDNPDPSSPFTITTKVKNTSLQNLQNVKVRFYKDTTVLGEQIIPYLSYGTETTVSLPAVIHDLGFYAMRVIADPDRTILESNELNNIALRPLPVGSVSISGGIEVNARNSSAEVFTRFYFRGSARYTGVFGGQQNVLGGLVKLTFNGKVYYTTTNSEGFYAIEMAGMPIGTYTAVIEVSDTRMTGRGECRVTVVSPPSVQTGKDVTIEYVTTAKETFLNGENIPVSVTVRNSGFEPLNNVLVYLYADNVKKDSFSISSLGVSTYTMVYSTVSYTGVGRHTIRATADPLNAIPEICETNNSLTKDVFILTNRPDLVVSTISGGSSIKVNKPAVLTANIQNIGVGYASTPFVVRFEVDGLLIGQGTVSQLQGGAMKQVSVSTTFSTAGLKYLRVYADYTGTILESDESNNIGGYYFTVLQVLPNVTFAYQSLINVPLVPGVGEPVQFNITAKNTGEIASPATQVRFTVNGTNYSSIADVPQLIPQQEVVITSNTNWIPAQRDNYVSKAVIDFAGQITEENEDDNAQTAIIIVGTGSDPGFDSLIHIKADKLYAHQGDTVKLSALVKNYSLVTTRARLEYYYLTPTNQRVFIDSAFVTVSGNDTASSGQVRFILPVAPVQILVKITGSNPPDFNANNNLRTLLVGDRAPVIAGLNTLTFSEDSSLTINLNDFVTDGGDPDDSLTWSFVSAANIFANYQHSTKRLTLTSSPNYYGIEQITAIVRDPQMNSDTVVVDVNVTQVIDYPGKPLLVTPGNSTVGHLSPVLFKWRKSNNSESYRFQLSEDSTFAAPVFRDSVLSDSTTQLAALSLYKNYYWRVRGKNTEADGEWSSVWNFKTLGRPNQVQLALPNNFAVNVPVTSVVFKWRKATEQIETISKYQFQLSTDSLFSNLTANDSTIADTAFNYSAQALVYYRTYYWRVRSGNENGWGLWSANWRFRVIVEKPAVPVLASPNNGETKMVQPITIRWVPTPRAEKYFVQVSEVADFSTVTIADTIFADTLKVLQQLAAPKTFYWRIKALNIGGESQYTVPWSFRTLGLPSAVTQIIPANGSASQPVQNLMFKWYSAKEQVLFNSAKAGGGSGFITSSVPAEVDEINVNTEAILPLQGYGNLNEPVSIGRYWLEVKADTNSFVSFYSDSTLTDTIASVSNLANSKQYFWRVKAKNEVGWGSFSTWYSFTTIVAKPETVELFSPGNNEVNISVKPIFKWRKSLRAELYSLQIALDSNFTSLVFEHSALIDTLMQYQDTLLFKRNYFWRLRASNIGGTSAFSQAWSFKTQPRPINAPSQLTAISNGNRRVSLSWLDNSGNEAGFIIERKLGDTTASVNYLRIDTAGVNSTSYNDTSVVPGTLYSYRIIAFSEDSLFAVSNQVQVTTLTDITEYRSGVPAVYSLMQNYPNPFNPSTSIRFDLPEITFVNLTIYNQLGEAVTTLISEEQQAGYHSVVWSASGVPSGLYFCVIKTEKYSAVKKLIYLK